MLPCGKHFFVWIERRHKMITAEDDIQYLIQIVQKDIAIKEGKTFLEAAPEKVSLIEKKTREMDEALLEVKGALDLLEKERVRLEGKVRDQNEVINQKKLTREKLNSNTEYKAMGREIDHLTGQVYKEEERILAILEEMEAKKKEIKEIKEKIGNEKGVLLAEKQKIEKEISDTEQRLRKYDDEKLTILPMLSDRVRTLYNRILNVKGDSGVANLVGDICQGCYSRVPPQMAHEVRRNDRILTCEVCGRILVYFETV